MKDGKFDFKTLLNEFEIYASTICFFMLTFLLTFNTLARYAIPGVSLTWMQELATIMFVWMIYFGVSGAVTKRKHLRIDFLLDIMPFKMKRVMLMISNVIFAVFNVYIGIILIDVIDLLGTSKTIMLGIPNVVVYSIIPFALIITVVRLVQDTIQLTKENESSLGASEPSLDLASCEKEFQAKLMAKAAAKKEEVQ